MVARGVGWQGLRITFSIQSLSRCRAAFPSCWGLQCLSAGKGGAQSWCIKCHMGVQWYLCGVFLSLGEQKNMRGSSLFWGAFPRIQALSDACVTSMEAVSLNKFNLEMVLRQSRRSACSPAHEAPELFRHFQTVLLGCVSLGWDLLMELKLTEREIWVWCVSQLKKSH